MSEGIGPFYRLEPEVAGGLASPSRIRRDVSPPAVENPHFVFEGWLGDELVEGFPCFLVTRGLGDRLAKLGATGFTLRPIVISRSEQFIETYPGSELPEFLWLDIAGVAAADDIGREEDGMLVVSQRVLCCLRQGSLSHCDVEEL
jgi:hypothetical protein